MVFAFAPSWPPVWTEAALQLVALTAGLVVIRAAGWFPFEKHPAAARWRPLLWSGAALGIPAVLIATLRGPGIEEWGVLVGRLLPQLPLLPLALVLGFLGFKAGQKSPLAQGDPPKVIPSVLGWGAYLFGYELVFRGLLLWALFRAAGAWPAVVISTVVYALAHLDKRPSEVLGSLPVGVVFAVCSLEAGSFWGAWLCHLALAVAFERGQVRGSRVHVPPVG